jgi:hypothetical protein
MLLTIINETKLTIENLSKLGDLDQVLWAVWSDKQDLITNNELLKTAYFYRLADRGEGQSKISNVAYNNSTDLHRFMWMIHCTLAGINGAVILKPGVALPPLFRSAIVDKLAKLTEANWGVIKGDHEKYFILNPQHSTIYKSNNLDDIVECCESNNLKVIHDDDLFYDQANMDINYKHWVTEDFKGFIDEDNRSSLPLYSENRKTITDYGTKNLVVYKSYEKDLTPFFDKFENVKVFKTVSEFNTMLDEFTDDTTWILGNFLVNPLTFFKLPFRDIILLVSKVLAVPNSVVWGKVYETPEIIHSTLKLHTLSKGATIDDSI